MSQLTHPPVSLTDRARAHRVALIAALLALAATTALVLVLAIGSDSEPTPDVVTPAQQSVRPDGGPDESNVASAVGPREDSAPATRPDESNVASAISGR